MIVLGIDTSLRSTGYGVLEVTGSRMKALECGNIKNSATMPLTKCLKAIYDKIVALIEAYHPEVIAIEEVIYAKNAKVMLVLGEARGAVLAAASNADIPVYEYEPRRMKRAVSGNALAEKEQIQRMVKTLLNLAELPQNDAADALGLAICHVNSHTRYSIDKPI